MLMLWERRLLPSGPAWTKRLSTYDSACGGADGPGGSSRDGPEGRTFVRGPSSAQEVRGRGASCSRRTCPPQRPTCGSWSRTLGRGWTTRSPCRRTGRGSRRWYTMWRRSWESTPSRRREAVSGPVEVSYMTSTVPPTNRVWQGRCRRVMRTPAETQGERLSGRPREHTPGSGPGLTPRDPGPADAVAGAHRRRGGATTDLPGGRRLVGGRL